MMKRRPPHSHSYLIRSRVTPGTSSTIASRRPRNLLINVDLPTLGRPSIATIGKPRRFLCLSNSHILSIVSSKSRFVESISTASFAFTSGECARVESIESLVPKDAFTSTDLSSISSSRLRALASRSAVRNTLRPASGATTVPISRPSTTIPRSLESIIWCCIINSNLRISGIALILDTLSVTECPRID